ncbi:MAG TPA: MFS transporter [Solirubrobacteraceae bacterium]|jgi:MFS family permease|nr:MFS transporter [Solirubrobacteraceae bacterium]
MATNYRSVLTEPGAARLMSTALVGRLPQGMSFLAILLLVREATHSYAAAGVAVGANALATSACAPLIGRLIDRFGRRRVVGPAAALQAAAYVLLALAAADHAATVLLILFAATAGALIPPIAAVVRTVLRDLFDDLSVRETAFGLEAIAQEMIWIVGPLLVTVVITLSSPKAALLMLAVLVFAGTLLFLRSPLLVRPEQHESEHPHRGSALASADLRWLLLPVTLTGFALGAVEVGIPALALHQGSRADSGLLLALWSLGSMTGGIRYSSARWRAALGSRYALLLLAECLFTVPLVAANSIAVAAACSFVAGLAVAPAFSCQYSLVGRVVIPGTEHEAFSWTLSGLIGGVAGGSALSGILIGQVGVKAPFILASAVACLAAIGASRFRGRFGAQIAIA